MSHSNSGPEKASLNILITGGAGFLGKALVSEALAADSPVKVATLRIYDLKNYDGPSDDRIEMIQGDLLDRKAFQRACRGVDVVIHAAAIVDWGTLPEAEVLAVNHQGTLNVLDCCREAGVKYLIYTSSIDVIYTGREMKDLDESVPYPDKHPNMYCKSKAMAEQAVMAANPAVWPQGVGEGRCQFLRLWEEAKAMQPEFDSIAVANQPGAVQKVVDHHGFEHVQLKMSGGAANIDGNIISQHLRCNHGQGFALRRVHFTWHYR